jgi:hypothetical protein
MLQQLSMSVLGMLQSFEDFENNPDVVEEYFYLAARFLNAAPGPLLGYPEAAKLMATILQYGKPAVAPYSQSQTTRQSVKRRSIGAHSHSGTYPSSTRASRLVLAARPWLSESRGAAVCAGIQGLALQHREAQKGILHFVETLVKTGLDERLRLQAPVMALIEPQGHLLVHKILHGLVGEVRRPAFMHETGVGD